MANLPNGLIDRAKAEGSRLEDRLGEAQAAVSAGDALGAEAAFGAYSAIVTEAARGSRADPQAAAELQPTVARHVMVLTDLLHLVPGPARPAAEKALSSSTMALNDLGTTPDGGVPGTGTGGAAGDPGSAGGNGGQVGAPGGGAAGGAGDGQGPGNAGGGVAAPPGQDKPAKGDDPAKTEKPPKPDKPANGSSDPACPRGLADNEHAKDPCPNHASR
jgi:hypothetical protein